MAGPAAADPEALCREILADARSRAQGIAREAARQAGALRTQAGEEAGRARQQRLEQARAEASRRVEAILATVPVEAGRMRSARVEELLQELYRRALERLAARDGYDYPAALHALVAQALAGMAGDAFVLRVAPGDGPVARAIARQVSRSAPRLDVLEDASVEGGVIVQDADGRQVWDDRLSARLARLWPDLRREIVARVAGEA